MSPDEFRSVRFCSQRPWKYFCFQNFLSFGIVVKGWGTRTRGQQTGLQLFSSSVQAHSQSFDKYLLTTYNVPGFMAVRMNTKLSLCSEDQTILICSWQGRVILPGEGEASASGALGTSGFTLGPRAWRRQSPPTYDSIWKPFCTLRWGQEVHQSPNSAHVDYLSALLKMSNIKIFEGRNTFFLLCWSTHQCLVYL